MGLPVAHLTRVHVYLSFHAPSGSPSMLSQRTPAASQAAQAMSAYSSWEPKEFDDAEAEAAAKAAAAQAEDPAPPGTGPDAAPPDAYDPFSGAAAAPADGAAMGGDSSQAGFVYDAASGARLASYSWDLRSWTAVYRGRGWSATPPFMRTQRFVRGVAHGEATMLLDTRRTALYQGLALMVHAIAHQIGGTTW